MTSEPEAPRAGGASDLGDLLAGWAPARAGPCDADREWLCGLRRRLAEDPGDPAAHDALRGERFARLCRFMGLDASDGRARFVASTRPGGTKRAG